jgi:hypothetical protein
MRVNPKRGTAVLTIWKSPLRNFIAGLSFDVDYRLAGLFLKIRTI